MAIHVMLTLDLNGNVSTEARERFYSVLKESHFVRRKLTTTWSAGFTPQSTRQGAEQFLKAVLERAVVSSGVRSYEVAYMFSDSQMVEYSNQAANASLLQGLQRFK